MRPNYKNRRMNAQFERTMRNARNDEEMAKAFEHNRRMCMQRSPFDATGLAEVAAVQWPDRPELAASFARCTWQWIESEKYTYLVDPFKHVLWQRGATLRLNCPQRGGLWVDVLQDGSIGGIEFLDKVFGGPTDAWDPMGLGDGRLDETVLEEN